MWHDRAPARPAALAHGGACARLGAADSRWSPPASPGALGEQTPEQPGPRPALAPGRAGPRHRTGGTAARATSTCSADRSPKATCWCRRAPEARRTLLVRPGAAPLSAASAARPVLTHFAKRVTDPPYRPRQRADEAAQGRFATHLLADEIAAPAGPSPPPAGGGARSRPGGRLRCARPTFTAGGAEPIEQGTISARAGAQPLRLGCVVGQRPKEQTARRCTVRPPSGAAARTRRCSSLPADLPGRDQPSGPVDLAAPGLPPVALAGWLGAGPRVVLPLVRAGAGAAAAAAGSYRRQETGRCRNLVR